MRKPLRLALVGLAALALIGVGAVLFLDGIARTAVVQGASSALSVPVTARAVSLRPLAGSVALSGLSVANPPGFSTQPMLELERGALSVRLASLLDDVVEVPSLELSGIHLRLEGRGTKTNYGALLANMKGGEAGEVKPESKAGAGPAKRFLVREIVIRDTTVEAEYALGGAAGKAAGAQKASATLPELRLKDIGNGESLTIADLTREILRALLEAAGSGNLPGLSAELSKDLQKNLSSYARQADGLKADLRGALENAKDLFKKDD